MSRESVLFLVVILGVASIVGAIYLIGGPTNQISTLANFGAVKDCGFVTVCEVQNLSGLVLTLTTNATSVESTGYLGFTISVVNPTPHLISLSLSDDWYIHGLAWPCNDVGLIPYGVAAFKGYRSLENISSAVSILDFGAISCFSMPTVTSYPIPPNSTYRPPYFITVSLLCGIHASPACGGKGSIEPVTYTLAAGDEWGDLVLVHFIVSSG